MKAREVIVGGGGVSGLVCAYALQRMGRDVLLVEASNSPGGLIRSERRDGYLIEHGPQSFSRTAELGKLCQELGIEGEILQAELRAPRFVLINGGLVRVPLSPLALFTSSLLSWGTKWSIVRDILGKTKPPEDDESIAQFTRRKFSAELLERLVGPFVSGIYAGDPERLSLRASFPQLYEGEQRNGSVIRGALVEAKAKSGPRERPALQSFREGNETFVRTLANKLGPAVRCGAEVTRIERGGKGQAARFAITLRSPSGDDNVHTDELVVALPPNIAANLLGAIDAEFDRILGGIEFAPVAVVALGYALADLTHELKGFGFLIPRSAGLPVLGTVWNSSLFPGRVPEGRVLLTSFVGGSLDPTVASLDVARLTQMTHKVLSPLLGIHKPPVFANVHVHECALPQYNLGHMERLARLEVLRGRVPGLWFVGNYLRGPAIGSCVEQALAVAGAIGPGSSPTQGAGR